MQGVSEAGQRGAIASPVVKAPCGAQADSGGQAVVERQRHSVSSAMLTEATLARSASSHARAVSRRVNSSDNAALAAPADDPRQRRPCSGSRPAAGRRPCSRPSALFPAVGIALADYAARMDLLRDCQKRAAAWKTDSAVKGLDDQFELA